MTKFPELLIKEIFKPKMNYLQELKPHPSNPRFIREEEYEKLKSSLTVFTKMLDVRPIAYDENNIIWGGNMRFKALQDLYAEGIITEVKDSWFKKLEGFTESEKHEFAIRDNKEYGNWDWDILANEWSDYPLQEWGLELVDWNTDEKAEEKPNLDYKSEYQIVINCTDEKDQEKQFEQLISLGYKCKILNI